MQVMDMLAFRTLVMAADTGSLSAAARRLRTQLSTVSRRVRDLEEELGVPLFARTGRGVRLTRAGERFVERARYVLRELDDASEEARGERHVDVAQLRLSVPLELALRLLPAVLVEVRAAHPTVVLDVQSDPRRVSLLEENFDAALRLGPLRESELVARGLGTVSLGFYARRPRTELGAMVVVAGARIELPTRSKRRARTVPLDGPVRVGTFTEAAEIAARSDLTAVLPSFTASDYLARRQLVRVVRDVPLPSTTLQLVYSQRLRGAPVLASLADATSRALDAAEARVRGAKR
jgi:DNA-binding transcriptional LysR family regulator